jgi:hypothetical protein
MIPAEDGIQRNSVRWSDFNDNVEVNRILMRSFGGKRRIELRQVYNPCG